jgi:hypothetical protein
MADLDEAIAVARRATAPDGPPGPEAASPLNNLGAMLMQRFEQTGSLTDLRAAAGALRDAAVAAPESPQLGKFLSNLSGVLLHLSMRSGDPQELEQAVRTARIAVAATNGSGLASGALAAALLTRLERTGSRDDLDEAITVSRASVASGVSYLDGEALRLSTLSDLLLRRHQLDDAAAGSGRYPADAPPSEDLDEAIDALRRAIALTDDGRKNHRSADRPERAAFLVRLGDALHRRFRRTGSPTDLSDSSAAFTAAVRTDTAPLALRLPAARRLADQLATSDPDRAADVMETAVRLLPEAAPRRLHRGDQQHALGSFAGLAGDAAALALAARSGTPGGRATRALRLLEAGRTVLLSQSLDARDDLGLLHEQRPRLAERFVALRDLLDRTAEEPAAPGVPVPHVPEIDRVKPATEFATVLDEIRNTPGFESFGLPPAAADLIAEARHGSVVMLNVSSYRCDALLLTRTGIAAVPLPGLTYATLTDQVNTFHRALHSALSDPVRAVRRRGQQELSGVLAWLWDTVTEPVLAALGHDRQPEPGSDWPRVWWVPGGILGLLPVHAAGHHTDAATDARRRTVLDRVVSSYTPSVRALRHARGRAARNTPASGTALLVAMPNTPGLPGDGALPHADDEVTALRGQLRHSVLLRGPDGTPHGATGDVPLPTKAAVLGRLPDCAVVHFACHGMSDPTDPSKSALLLHDHAMAPLTAVELGSAELGRAQLAYLSACETAATRAPALTDEAIHLASACQLAGFPHVIGTLWNVDDRVCVDIAKSFYAHLSSRDGALETDRAAHALHAAVRPVRDLFPGTPSLWAAHLHTGA